MAIDFPNSPTTNDSFTAGGKKWIFNGTSWTLITANAYTIPTGEVTTAMISDGTILNVDINASAAIDQSKISGLTTDLAAKAPLASPTFTGTPTLPTGTIATTQTAGNNTTAIATTAFVGTAVANLVDSAPATLNTLDELALALGDDANFATTTATAIGLKAPLASPTFTGVPLAPTAAANTNTTQLATTAFVTSAVSSLDNIGDVALTATSLSYVIGDTGPAGGKIFQTPSTAGNTTGKYFEAAPSGSPDVTRTWAVSANQNAAVSGADGTAIGTGQQNTIDIVAQSGNLAASSAAAYANDYTSGGYSDWFLPSIDELTAMYTYKTEIGGFTSGSYWSSSEYDQGVARFHAFPSGSPNVANKPNNFSVRPVRSFAALASNDILKWNGTAWVNDTSLALKANLASPTFTGMPTSPTASAGTNTTQLATTAFVTTAVVNASPQTTVYTSGSGTYTVPSGARWLSVKMVGGGGGGATGHSDGSANGVIGTATTFGTGIASAGPGGLVNDNGGIGTASTMISGGVGLALSGGDGGPSAAPYGSGRAANEGGNGGSSAFGGAGAGRGGSNAASGGAGKANTGGGGGAGGGSNVPGTYAGGGGASGGYVECVIASPSATYSYAVGAGGAGGSNGSTTGGAGGSGVIYVVAYF